MGRKKKFINKKEAVTFHVFADAGKGNDDGPSNDASPPGGDQTGNEGDRRTHTLQRQQFELGEYGFPSDGYDYSQHFRASGAPSAVFVPAKGAPMSAAEAAASSHLPTVKSPQQVDKAESDLGKKRTRPAEFVPEEPVEQWTMPVSDGPDGGILRGQPIPQPHNTTGGTGGITRVIDARALPSAAAEVLMRPTARQAVVLSDVGVAPEADILDALFGEADETVINVADEAVDGDGTLDDMFGGEAQVKVAGDLSDDFVIQANEGVLVEGAASLSRANIEQFEDHHGRRGGGAPIDIDEDDLDSMGRADSLAGHSSDDGEDDDAPSLRQQAGAVGQAGMPVGYSRSEASRTARTQPLQVLDEQFARLMAKEYGGYDDPDGDFPADDMEYGDVEDDEDDWEDSDDEFGNRARLKATLREFEQEHMGAQGRSFAGPADAAEHAELKEKILASVERFAEEDEDDDGLGATKKKKHKDAYEMVVVDAKPQWDVQSYHAAQSSVMSAYQPSEIDDRPPRTYIVDEDRRLRLTKRGNMPVDGLLPKQQAVTKTDDAHSSDSADETAAAAAKAATAQRSRHETPAERAERKRLVKEHRKARRAEKKQTKQAFTNAAKKSSSAAAGQHRNTVIHGV